MKYPPRWKVHRLPETHMKSFSVASDFILSHVYVVNQEGPIIFDRANDQPFSHKNRLFKDHKWRRRRLGVDSDLMIDKELAKISNSSEGTQVDGVSVLVFKGFRNDTILCFKESYSSNNSFSVWLKNWILEKWTDSTINSWVAMGYQFTEEMRERSRGIHPSFIDFMYRASLHSASRKFNAHLLNIAPHISSSVLEAKGYWPVVEQILAHEQSLLSGRLFLTGYSGGGILAALASIWMKDTSGCTLF